MHPILVAKCTKFEVDPLNTTDVTKQTQFHQPTNKQTDFFSEIESIFAFENSCDANYRKTSSISRTKYQNASQFVLQLSLPNLLKPNVKLRLKM